MCDYSKMTSDDFYRILCAHVSEASAVELLSIPGAYEVFAEHYNNSVLDEWREEQELEAELASYNDGE